MQTVFKNLDNMQDKKIFLNTTYQIIGKVITSGIGILGTIFLTRYLDIKEFGQYSLVFTYTNFAIIFADFGLGTLLTREVAAKRHSASFVSQIFSFRLFLSIVIILISIFALLFLPYSDLVKKGIFISFFGILLLQLSAIFWAHFQGEFAFKKIATAQISMSGVTLLLILIGVFLHLSLLYFILAQVIGTASGFIISYLFYKETHTLLFFNKQIIKAIIFEAWPLALGTIVSVAYFKIDALLLSYYFNPSTTNDFSIYSVAYKPFEVMIVFGGFFIQTLFPLFSGSIESKHFRKLYKHYFFYAVLLSVGTTAIIYVFANPLIQILGGIKYVLAIAPLQILSLAAGLSILSGFFTAVAISARRQLTLLYIALFALIINVSLNIAIIPQYSFIGASWTTVLTQAFILFATAWVTLDIVKKK